MFAAKHLGDEEGQPHELNLHTDSTAARGVAMRQGFGKVKHPSIRHLWIQSFTVTGVPRASDMFTHH